MGDGLQGVIPMAVVDIKGPALNRVIAGIRDQLGGGIPQQWGEFYGLRSLQRRAAQHPFHHVPIDIIG